MQAFFIFAVFIFKFLLVEVALLGRLAGWARQMQGRLEGFGRKDVRIKNVMAVPADIGLFLKFPGQRRIEQLK